MDNIYKSEQGRNVVLGKYKEVLAKWPVENMQYTVETSFGDTFIIESGSEEKPPILLLHGSVANSATWFNDVALLSKTHNVYAIDSIGEAGLSASSRPGYESGAYQKWLSEVTAGLGLGSCSIVAMSLGGWMALSFATSYPDKVDNLVLICPGGLASEKASFLWKAVIFSLLGKWGQTKTLKLIGADLSSSEQKTDLSLATLTFQHFKPRTAKMPIFSEDSLSKLTMPILMFFGDSDQLIHAEKSIKHLKLAAPHAKIEVLPDTGHLIVNQTDKIIHFLTKVSTDFWQRSE